MKTSTSTGFFVILSVIIFLLTHQANGQNMHNSSNAVSIENESNTTTGWTGTAVFTSDTENPYDGLYSIRGVTSLSNGREIRYTFPAVIGETYNISIWARQGEYSHLPAFANWAGFTGFATRLINSAIWTEYSFTLVATSATPIIRVYTSPSSGPIQGSTIFIDRVSIFAASDTEAPSAPGNLTASDTTTTSVFLSWTASSDNIGVTAYDIYANNTQLTTVPSSSSTLLVNNLIPATSYEFFVRARDAAGNTSDQSNTVQIITQVDTTPPSVPENLNATDITQTSLALSWNASTDNVAVTTYEVFVDSVSVDIVNSPALSISLSGLTPGTIYQLAVTASDGAGNTSAFSTPLEVTTEAPDTTPPSIPENLIATDITQTSLTLSWDASTDNVAVTTYEVFVDSVSSGIVNSPALSISLLGLAPGTTYQLAVTASDGAGNTSAFSTPLQVTTGAPDTTPPSVPENLISTDITQTSLTLSWDASTDNIGVSSYEVFVDSVSAGIVNSPVLSISLSGLTPGTTYQLAVTATDEAGNTSAFSIPLEVTTDAPDTTPPSVPENLIATVITQTSLTLSWNASTDNIGVSSYEVFVDSVSAGIVNSPALSISLSGLTPGTTYQLAVTATDEAGNTSAFSIPLEVTTEAPDTTPPSVPENLIATVITQTSLTLSWNASTDNIGVSSYEVFVDSVSAGIVNSPALSISLSGLTPGTTYQLAVTATDEAGNTSAFSIPLEVTTDAPDTTPPSVPENLIATVITQTSLTLSWNASTDNIGVSSYEVFVDSVSAGIVNSPALSISLSGLTPGTTYQLAVTATDEAGNTSAFSIPLEVTTEAPDTTPPSVPENLIATVISKNTLTLNWSPSTDNTAVSGYEIFQDHISIGLTDNQSLTFPVSGLSAATTYAFSIVAFDAAENTSAFSDTLLVTTLDVIVYTDLNANNINVDWTARDLHISGRVGIQTQPDSVYLLSVNGAIRAKEIVVETGWADFVFEEGYSLPALSEVEEHIRIYGHLKDIPSAADIARDGANLGDISVKLLQKIEELTLYSIELEKRLQKLETENASMKKIKRKKPTIELKK